MQEQATAARRKNYHHTKTAISLSLCNIGTTTGKKDLHLRWLCCLLPISYCMQGIIICRPFLSRRLLSQCVTALVVVVIIIIEKGMQARKGIQTHPLTTGLVVEDNGGSYARTHTHTICAKRLDKSNCVSLN